MRIHALNKNELQFNAAAQLPSSSCSSQMDAYSPWAIIFSIYTRQHPHLLQFKTPNPSQNPQPFTPPFHSSGAISPAHMALILPVAASMLAWALLFFFTWVFTVGKLEQALPPLVDAHNSKVEKDKRGKKKTIAGDLFDVQNRIVSIIHALLCIAVTAHQIREEGISIGQVNSQLQVRSFNCSLFPSQFQPSFPQLPTHNISLSRLSFCP
jgi:hypothetical protein